MEQLFDLILAGDISSETITKASTSYHMKAYGVPADCDEYVPHNLHHLLRHRADETNVQYYGTEACKLLCVWNGSRLEYYGELCQEADLIKKERDTQILRDRVFRRERLEESTLIIDVVVELLNVKLDELADSNDLTDFKVLIAKAAKLSLEERKIEVQDIRYNFKKQYIFTEKQYVVSKFCELMLAW